MTSFLTDDHELLMLVDAHALIYRAYFAFPPLTSPDGMMVNAAFGFSRILLSAINEMQPTYLAVVYDHPEPTFRHKEYEDYKAHREKMPDDLIPQIGLTQEIVEALNIPIYEQAGYEADDLIGSLSRQAAEQEQPTIIVTGDQDIFQLVNDWVHVWLPGRGQRLAEEFDREGVEQKIGVYPEQVIDLKALMGDSSDNIPGIRGVGPKTAKTLIQDFGSLESVYQALEQGQEHKHFKGAMLTKLEAGKENAFLSQKLATIELNVPIELDLEACHVTSYNKEEAVEIFQDLNFKSLITSLPNDTFESSVQESLF